ncbi:MAG: helix-turn-helix domain-containing protein [Mycoplasmoidaceae bacterium]|nr:helix-turn-helix domain-containing protein [Mycoplasmoidaceae bacterium]
MVKDLRDKLLLSQEEMADKLGVAFSTVNRYENGHFEPTIKIKRKIKSLAIANGID